MYALPQLYCEPMPPTVAALDSLPKAGAFVEPACQHRFLTPAMIASFHGDSLVQRRDKPAVERVGVRAEIAGFVDGVVILVFGGLVARALIPNITIELAT